jgi:hypothetical protein
VTIYCPPFQGGIKGVSPTIAQSLQGWEVKCDRLKYAVHGVAKKTLRLKAQAIISGN